jgi:hypothetical protein
MLTARALDLANAACKHNVLLSVTAFLVVTVFVLRVEYIYFGKNAFGTLFHGSIV